jgi:hypothetical protein
MQRRHEILRVLGIRLRVRGELCDAVAEQQHQFAHPPRTHRRSNSGDPRRIYCA